MRSNFANPHDTFNNHDQAVRIAKRRWKKNAHRLVRRHLKKEMANG